MKQLAPWYWRSLPLQNRTGSDIFALLFNDHYPIATLLESPFPNPRGQPLLCRYSICAGSPRLSHGQPRIWTPTRGQILPCLRSLLAGHHEDNSYPDHLPFTGGWLGWLGYDLAWEIESLPSLKCDSFSLNR
jgi:para-aminobenzoate synthetase component 1